MAADDIKSDMQDVLYGAMSAYRYATSEQALDALMPHVDRYMAAELRRLADELDVVKAEMREVDDRNIRSSGLGEGIARLRARADELDPS